MKLANFLDLAQNEVRNATVQNLSSAPSSPKAGQVYYDTTLNTARQWNGTVWLPFDATQATGIPNTALATNPLARANHTGTQPSSTISDLSTVVHAYTLDTFAAPAASVPFNAQRITGLADPVGAQDAGTKNYIDANIQAAAMGIQSKPPVTVVSTTNQGTLSGLLTIDGITLTAGSRVLLAAQTTTSQNGPWIAATGAWTRPSGDASPNSELTLGALWYVEQGTVGAGSQYILAAPTSGTITVGTTNVTVNKFNGGVAYTASNGVSLTGANFAAAVVAAGGVLAGAGGLQVDTSVVTRKFAQTIGDGSSTSFTLTHNLGTTDIIAQIRDSSGNEIITDNQATGVNTLVVTFATAPATNAYRVIVHG